MPASVSLAPKPKPDFPGIVDGNTFPQLCLDINLPPNAQQLVKHAIVRRLGVFGPMWDGQRQRQAVAQVHGAANVARAGRERKRQDRVKVAADNIESRANVTPVVSSVIGFEEVMFAVTQGWIAKQQGAGPSRVQVLAKTSSEAAEYAEQQGLKAVIMNFSNGSSPCGGYLSGARAQEEALCLEYPDLLPSLWRSKQCGFYPNGPAAARKAFPLFTQAPREAVRDVVFTTAIPRERTMSNLWSRLPLNQRPRHAIVSAAAADRNRGEEYSFMLDHMETAFLAPKLFDPTITAFIGGAWGAGAFGNNVDDIARMWNKIVQKHDGLYSAVIFGVPSRFDSENHRAFQRVITTSK